MGIRIERLEGVYDPRFADVLHVRRVAYHGNNKMLHLPDDGKFRDEFDERSIVVVAISGEAVVASCRATFSSHVEQMIYPRSFEQFPLQYDWQEVAELSRACVLPEFQRNGLVKRLLRQLGEDCLDHRRPNILAGAMQPQLPLYERYGFSRTGYTYNSVDLGTEHELIVSTAELLMNL